MGIGTLMRMLGNFSLYFSNVYVNFYRFLKFALNSGIKKN
jgi:hypothetical protein